MFWIAPILIVALYAEQKEKEFMKFCKDQLGRLGYIPSREEYMSASRQAYHIANPEPYPKWKSVLAAIITRLFRL